MALVVADRVKQTAASISGTGTYTLSGTFTGFQTFTDGVGDGNTTYYAAVQDANFEIGIGTYTASGATLARTTILQSSNSDNAVSWSSATPTIFTTYPADKAVFKDASGNINGTFVGNITGNVTGNTSGTAATVTGAAQTNITSVGTLSSLTTSGDITVGDDLTVNGGQIDLRTDSGAVSKMKFYCEVSNAHAQTLQAQPHSASSSAVLVLPTASGTLLGSGDAVSVKNSYLLDTDIKIGEDDETKIDFETADEIHFYAANVEQVYLADNIFGPQSDSDVDLGTTGVRWKDAYLDSVTVTDNVTIGGNLTVNGTTTTIDTTNTVVKDSLLGLNNGASSNSNDSGIIIERGSTGNDALLIWDESADKWALGTTTSNASSTGNLNMTTGTLVANIEGNVTGNVTGNTSGTAATVTSAAQTNITSLGTLTGLTVDGDVTLTGADYNVVWDKSDNALEFGDNAKATFGASGDLEIKHNGNNSFITDTGTGSLYIQGATSIFLRSGNGVHTYLQATKNGSVDLYHNNSKKFETTSAGVTVTGVVTADGFTIGSAVIAEAELEQLDGITAGTVAASKAVVVDANKDVASFRNVTLTGELDAATGDFSGDVDVDGTLEADAITVNGTALNTVIADEATALAIALG